MNMILKREASFVYRRLSEQEKLPSKVNSQYYVTSVGIKISSPSMVSSGAMVTVNIPGFSSW